MVVVESVGLPRLRGGEPHGGYLTPEKAEEVFPAYAGVSPSSH